MIGQEGSLTMETWMICSQRNLFLVEKYKAYIITQIKENTLGSAPNEILLKLLKPKYWFSAHLHVKFEAEYNHSVKVVNPDEILLDEDDQSVQDDDYFQPQTTHFLALDKILPNREFYKVYIQYS